MAHVGGFRVDGLVGAAIDFTDADVRRFVVSAVVMPSRAAAWIMALRPRTLPVGVVPVAVGSAVAAQVGGVAWMPAVAALLGALLLQIGCNLVNDLHDWKHGADGGDRLGPRRATAGGLLSPAEVQHGYQLAFALAALVGGYLIMVGGWPIAAVGIAGLLCAYGYTAGPFPLGYLGLGDLLVFFFFGPVAVAGTVYVQLGWVPQTAWWASVPVGALATAVLVINNYRDADTDRVAGKRTLAVRWGRPAMRCCYCGLIVVAMVLPPALASLGQFPQTVWWTLLAAPLAWMPLRALFLPLDGARLNDALAGTAHMLLIHGGLLAAALAGALGRYDS
jgi:1,4-dihydroxy-2-naphthoate octaprenyltransferase